MKRSIFGLLVFSIFLTSCNDDDDDTDPQGGDPMQPPSGTISATINGENFSGSNNVARYLSFGEFIIRSEDGMNSFSIQIEEFIGNGVYSISEELANTAQYFSFVNSQSLGFRSLTGELTISEYDESSKTFNVSFDINLVSIENSSVTMTAEGSYSNLKILELEEPESSQVVAFHSSMEYYNYSHESNRSIGNNMKIQLVSEMNDTIEINLFFFGEGLNQVEATISIISAGLPDTIFTLNENEILAWENNKGDQLISCHLRAFISDLDFEIWIKEIPYTNALSNSGQVVYLVENADTTFFDEAILTKALNASTLELMYVLTATKEEEIIVWLYFGSTVPSEPVSALLFSGEVGSGTLPPTSSKNEVEFEIDTTTNRAQFRLTTDSSPQMVFAGSNITFEDRSE
jgi:hypothetical protein